MENSLKAFRSLSSAEVGFLFFAFCGALAPGLISIWIFDPELIRTASTPKLILLSFCLTLPFVAINSTTFAIFDSAPKTEKEKEEDPGLAGDLAVGILASLFIFIPPVFLRVFFNISFLWYVGIVFFASLVVALLLGFFARKLPQAGSEAGE